MNVIAHYLSTAFKSMDPEEAVSLYSKKFHSTTITTITPVPELHDPLFIHKIWLPSPIEEPPPYV